jgi:hypothetical protein
MVLALVKAQSNSRNPWFLLLLLLRPHHLMAAKVFLYCGLFLRKEAMRKPNLIIYDAF